MVPSRFPRWIAVTLRTRMRPGLPFVSVLVAGAAVGSLAADPTSSLPPAATRAFLDKHCVDCHSGTEAEGGFDLAAVAGPLDDEKLRRWVLVHDRVTAGEMPPADQPQPTAAERAAAIRPLAAALVEADRARADVVLRRLNRAEYENTVRDLFGTDVLVKSMLPTDAAVGGFDTVGEGLAVSAEAVQAYLAAADAVLDAVFGPAKEPQRIHHVTNLKEQTDHHGKPQIATQFHRVTPEGLLVFNSYNSPTNLVNFARLRAPAGTYRVTIKARTVQGTEPLIMRVFAGDTIVNRRERHLVGFFAVPPGDDWTTIEFTDRLIEDGGTFRPVPYALVDTRDPEHYNGPGIEMGEIVVDGPLEEWPPPARRRLLGDVDPATATANDARAILAQFLPRAFRRPVTSAEAAPYIALATEALEAGRPFEEALRMGLRAALCAPEFLYLDEPARGDKGEAGLVGQHALACRLSYFLWSSMPDDELTRLADAGKLDDPAELRRQVERMLADPKSKALTDNFAGQWLALRDIDFTEPDKSLYPEYDEFLRHAIIQETRLFFEHVLQKDLGVKTFIDSDFTFLNGRLAEHYGVPGVEGLDFRKVTLPADSVRGGVMTQASVLKVTANGTITSPVLRGVWMLKNILGQAVPPPPGNVPAVEPDIRGATTLREQLAKHRDVEGCNACHRRIDPPGFALESFDVIGGWRENYRVSSDGVGKRPAFQRDPFTNDWIKYRIGPPVDATGQTADGRPFADIREFKRLLLADEPGLARGIATKLATYGLGRRMGFSDRAAIADIVDKSTGGGHGFRELIHQVVASELFRRL